jgi:alkanesulfonate monooxygenase SsuD/methylene tetrahydromethanopterin reductase-like flavin-dependent oxidoreductase (luciferase family)
MATPGGPAPVPGTRFPLQIGIATGQTEPWERLVERWRHIERLGFDSAWVFDHFLAAGGVSAARRGRRWPAWRR